MSASGRPAAGSSALAEMREFASFAKGEQRYIRRSLDVGLGRCDAEQIWARDVAEQASIRAQLKVYRRLDEIRAHIPDSSGLNELEPMMSLLVITSGFDLGQDRLMSFSSYRYLYERLLGAAVRPWLPAAFCCAASLPHLHPERRRALLQSISQAAATAAGWSSREPMFFPHWVEKVEISEAA